LKVGSAAGSLITISEASKAVGLDTYDTITLMMDMKFQGYLDEIHIVGMGNQYFVSEYGFNSL
ncbi:hypothetical protein, partial [Mycobacterium tuberculosis]|uniref:hypothetical protein n=1 Tax=Mycobacterium tuberculosis TaxID=1773 RepID=UPI001BDF9AF9